MPFSDGIADFRSDTVTRPTEAMRKAMAEAEVGDDVYGEDPTVNRLQEEAAAAVGKEAALFLPSGTMGNQIAVSLHARPGEALLCVRRGHVRLYEAGGAAGLSGVQIMPVDTADGTITRSDVEDATRHTDHHYPRVAMLVWENTHNMSGGTVVPLATMTDTTEAARARDLAVHLDGARLFNAVTASGVAAERYAELADTVQFCLSKGLGAPVGSIIAGSAAMIDEAHRRRKRLGGGMRQAGILAAGGLLALEHRHHLDADHELASALGAAIRERHPQAVDGWPIQTNMVLVDESALPGGEGAFRAYLAEAGVLVGYAGPAMLRFVTHRDVDEGDARRVVAILDELSRD